MPWSVGDVDKHKKGLSQSQKRQWVSTANSVLEKCLKDGGSQNKCEAKAIKIANSKVNNESMEKYDKINNNYEIRNSTHQGRDFIVVPVVMMREGVHHGSRGALYHSIEELGRFPNAWDGIPIVVNHPRDEDGNDIPANSPGVIDREAIGRVYNTHVDGDRLKAEAWLDTEKLQQISMDTFQYVEARRPLNVSVGVFTDQEETTGMWNGEAYTAVAHNHRPDHLALLPDTVGACSVEDGCALGFNEKKGGDEMFMKTFLTNLSYSGTESTRWRAPSLSDFDVSENRWDQLSTQEKSKIKSHYLVTGENWEDLKFPVVNPNSGKLNENALRAVISGRGAQADIPASKRSSARRKAYRLLNSKFDAELEVPENLEEMKEYNLQGYSLNLINDNAAYKQIISKITNKLDSMDSEQSMNFLEEVYDNYFVYRKVIRENRDEDYFKQNYQENQEGKIEFTGEPIKVKKNVEYLNVNVMDKKEKVQKLVNNESTKFTKEDQKWLENLEDGQLDKLIPDENQHNPCCPDKVDALINNENSKFAEEDKDWLLKQDAKTIDKLFPNEAAGQNKGEKQELEINADSIKKAFSGYNSKEEAIDALFPDELASNLKKGLKTYRENRQVLIKQITTNTEQFTEDELKVMDDNVLEKIANSVMPQTNYGPLGSGFDGNNEEEEGVYPPEVYEAQFSNNKE